MIVRLLTEKTQIFHHNYITSKLVYGLKEVLNTESKLTIIVTISPDINDLPESRNTCRFGGEAKKLKQRRAKEAQPARRKYIGIDEFNMLLN